MTERAREEVADRVTPAEEEFLDWIGSVDAELAAELRELRDVGDEHEAAAPAS